MRQFKVLAIAGIPGAGKTELATRLSARFGWEVISTGDIARRVDPDSLAAGKLADESLFRRAFLEAFYGTKHDGPVILDGLPRSRGQIALLPEESMVIALTCRPDIAIERQKLRARPGDTDEIIEARTREQSDLLEVERADGWLYVFAGWNRTLNTSQRSREEIEERVSGYLTGEKREVF